MDKAVEDDEEVIQSDQIIEEVESDNLPMDDLDEEIFNEDLEGSGKDIIKFKSQNDPERETKLISYLSSKKGNEKNIQAKKDNMS
jgi:hypothetical protein